MKNAFKTRLLNFLVPLYPSAFSSRRCSRVWLHKMAKLTPHFNHAWWVQVGANDGGDWDSFGATVRANSLKALLIEPVSHLFEKLEKAYANHEINIRLEKIAIGPEAGTAALKVVPPEHLKDLPPWASQIASLRHEITMWHESLIPDLHQRLIDELVEVLPLSHVFIKHGIKEVMFLQIDTEGYDAQVLKSIDFNQVKINALQFEHKHLHPDEYKTTLFLLHQNGFETVQLKGDTIAWDKKAQKIGNLIAKYLSV